MRPARCSCEEILEHLLAILGGEAHPVQRDAELARDGARILVVARRTCSSVVVLVPVAHEEALHVVPLLLEQQGGHGGIDAAGEADDDAGARGHGAHSTRAAALQRLTARTLHGRLADRGRRPHRAAGACRPGSRRCSAGPAGCAAAARAPAARRDVSQWVPTMPRSRGWAGSVIAHGAGEGEAQRRAVRCRGCATDRCRAATAARTATPSLRAPRASRLRAASRRSRRDRQAG